MFDNQQQQLGERLGSLEQEVRQSPTDALEGQDPQENQGHSGGTQGHSGGPGVVPEDRDNKDPDNTG